MRTWFFLICGCVLVGFGSPAQARTQVVPSRDSIGKVIGYEEHDLQDHDFTDGQGKTHKSTTDSLRRRVVYIEKIPKPDTILVYLTDGQVDRVPVLGDHFLVGYYWRPFRSLFVVTQPTSYVEEYRSGRMVRKLTVWGGGYAYWVRKSDFHHAVRHYGDGRQEPIQPVESVLCAANPRICG
ncbi:MAG: hypothetical protein HYY50_05520 [Candidatus Kerfeldbacteria bacterium]|nr:hypothetical protein [Candidatus Kerfeldbacteria bacterium]